ncbi:hypothetical protein OAH77_04550 [Flavobacteriaceae bacterium]|nr:hypothetical protein [Flavobacteriaceae bacterium]
MKISNQIKGYLYDTAKPIQFTTTVQDTRNVYALMYGQQFDCAKRKQLPLPIKIASEMCMYRMRRNFVITRYANLYAAAIAKELKIQASQSYILNVYPIYIMNLSQKFAKEKYNAQRKQK